MTKSRLLKYAFLGITAALIAHYLIKKEEKPKGHPRDYAEIACRRHHTCFDGIQLHQLLCG